jgi:predicted hydrolase (HD superfamily)
METERNDYLLLAQKLLEKNIFYHSLALEACMAGIYDYLSATSQLKPSEPPKTDWALAGLIHDLDYFGDYKSTHPTKVDQILTDNHLPLTDTVKRIVLSHGWKCAGGVKPENQAEWSIFCADSLTGLIVAVALVYPTKKLADVKSSSVLKRFLKEPKFAAGTRRDDVALCQNPDVLNIPLEKFIELCLNSMQSIALSIGL